MEIYAKGKRSLVYLINYKGKKAVLKKETRNLNRIQNEVRWLKILNKHKLGPKLYSFGNNYLIEEFIEGERILDFLSKNKSSNVIKEILRQCRILDKLKVNKYELKNPYKHIIIGKRVVMIDFERCKFTEKPKNVTQFIQFLISHNLIRTNKEKLLLLLKQYKKNQSEENYHKLYKHLKL